ncbi:TPA: hypothetical protein DF272_01400 [Candidatus Falkowbacteria bacterium]|nr:hypothetical protein [Candidatus Falkowbacteria bacterium]
MSADTLVGAILLGLLVWLIIYRARRSRRLRVDHLNHYTRILEAIHDKGHADAAARKERKSHYDINDSELKGVRQELVDALNHSYLSGFDDFNKGKPSFYSLYEKQNELLQQELDALKARLDELRHPKPPPKQLELKF